jgi:myo-inositol-1-phosphate synthase
VEHGRPGRRVGVAVVGLGGAVATTAAAGVELLRQGLATDDGLPLAGGDLRALAAAAGLVDYPDLVFAGWDLADDDLAKAAEVHAVLEPWQRDAVAPALSAVTPWPGVGDPAFCRNIDGEHRMGAGGHRAAVEAIAADLERFRDQGDLDNVVVVNLASTERRVDPALPVYATPEAFAAGLDRDDPDIGPAMLYAYAAITAGAPYANFTPSVSVDVPALLDLAAATGVPVAGKDGKTGQTLLKTVLAPALRARALRVEGWFSTNILGNRDGHALDDPASLAAKLDTKAALLDDLLGYHVEDHLVTINYYRPRGDAKEAWDNIDLVGFLGQRMQLKVNFLCRDSILAAPLVLEIARVLDAADVRGQGGIAAQLGVFFKAPLAAPGTGAEHALHVQERRLRDWLVAAAATRP